MQEPSVIEKIKQNLEFTRILVFDSFLSDEKAEELGVEKVSLETIFSESDVITNHLADNAQTKGMLNIKHFSLMKKGSAFINTGRGAQVVESDLIEALNRLSSAVYIVFCRKISGYYGGRA